MVMGAQHNMDKWQKAYMTTAETFGALSSAKRLKVGAIIVRDNRILSIGYNGMPSGWTNICEDDNNATKKEVLHAESNCLMKLARSSESGLGADIYITHAPCMECAKLVYGAGISRVFYRTEYKNTDGTNFLSACNVEVERV
jgi:dCMP deaminase